ncbi:MAG: 30S ribosomal protein S15 [Elusimicrobiales bacterium]|jgi:small subunit ribosomal protein S15|uniref:Small ribosomal subunit protein uS15 n=1 Tax=uncultured bacterium URE12 TaxID=581111 RepID=C0JZU0_9BACT|nr:30S ribosomal protein S15 [uncultured bacterium URE12]MBP5287544.1 30S ribosomal protein S15 [Elusimicrobiales bacterium]
MALTKNQKREIAEKFSEKPNDTGATAVQIALITERIKYLTEHTKANPKDHASNDGLVALVSQRKSLLAYLERTNREEYKKVIAKLGLRK